MATGEGAPSPFDIILNGVGYMCARDGQGNPSFTEIAPQAQEPSGEQVQTWRGWEGGIGVHRDLGTEESRKTLSHTSSAAGGGIDSGFGVITKGPALTTTTVGAATTKVRRLLGPWLSLYWAAIDNKLYSSASPLMTTPTLANTFTSGGVAQNIRDMTVFQGTNTASGGLMYIMLQNGAIYTYDGTSFVMDGPSTGRTTSAQAVLKTADSGATYTDYTAEASGAGVVALGGLDTLANGDWLLIGLDRPFINAVIDMDGANVNAVVNTLLGQYWTGSAWVTLGITDGTAAGGAPFAVDGTISWVRPAATWAKSVLTALGGAGVATVQPTAAYYWVRFSIATAALTAGTAIATITLGYAQEGDACAVVGNRLNVVRDRNKIMYTTDGGTSPTWNESADPVGSYTGQVVGLVGANNTPFLIRTTDFGSNNSDGTATSYLPDIFKFPASGIDDQGYCSFLNQIYFAHDYGFYQFDAVSGGVQAVGPERLMLNDQIQVRITAITSDRTHALYGAAFCDKTGDTWLARWGGYRQVTNPESGTVEWVRLDAWFPICYLGQAATMKTYSIFVWADSSNDKIYAAMGNGDGKVLTVLLPTQMSPLNDSNMNFNLVDSYAYLPIYMGADPSQPITPFAWAVQAKNLAAVTCTVALETRAPGQSSWVAQGTANDVSTVAGGQRIAFDTLTTAAGVGSYGIEMRLKLHNNNANNNGTLSTNTVLPPPIIETFSLFYEQPARQKRIYRFTVLADDYVTDQSGRQLPWGGPDWKAAVDTAAASNQPMTMIRPDGSSENVLVRNRQDTLVSTGTRRGRRRAMALTVATAQ